MKTQIQETYLKFRKGDCRLRAGQALHMAKTVCEWQEAESAGLVRLVAEDERENYFDVYGTENCGSAIATQKNHDAIVRAIELYGNYCIYSEVNNGSEASGDDWEMVDSVGMCTGYRNPLDPFENYCVSDLMRAALDRIPQPGNVDELCDSL